MTTYLSNLFAPYLRTIYLRVIVRSNGANKQCGKQYRMGELIMGKSLNEKAMLVRLNISQYTGKRKDKKATETVETVHGVNDVGKFFKETIKRDVLKEVQKVANEIRTFHYRNTLPWNDNGDRLLPVMNFEKYSEEMRLKRQQFEAVVETFCSQWDSLIDEARARLNGLFNENDYPRNVRKKFGYDIHINPIPIGNDFRVELNTDEVERIQAEIETRVTEALQNAQNDLYRRLYEAIAHLVERLTTKDAIFRDSIIGNLVELVELIPRLNVTGDTQLDTIRQMVEEKLCGIQPDILREDAEMKDTVVKEANAILEVLGGLYEQSDNE